MAEEIVKNKVEIGYLEKSDTWQLGSRFFPSKVGGKPAWLDLKNIPEKITCSVCNKGLIFLCQIYVPRDELNTCYHRTLFVFVCLDPKCCKPNNASNFKVYRCQLEQVNEFYSSESPQSYPEWQQEVCVEKYNNTCVVCGALGPHCCSKCKKAFYCSREHQVFHWKSGHKQNCGTDELYIDNKLLLPEFEIKIETEEEESEACIVKTEEENLYEYERLVSEGKAGTLKHIPAEFMEEMALSKEDKYLKKFKETLLLCSDQVIRYDLGGEPLWISKPESLNVPSCGTCGSDRQFEFQILSTMLNYLDIDSVDASLDWGNLLIFTCQNSCSEGEKYTREFLFKQDIV